MNAPRLHVRCSECDGWDAAKLYCPHGCGVSMTARAAVSPGDSAPASPERDTDARGGSWDTGYDAGWVAGLDRGIKRGYNRALREVEEWLELNGDRSSVERFRDRFLAPALTSPRKYGDVPYHGEEESK